MELPIYLMNHPNVNTLKFNSEVINFLIINFFNSDEIGCEKNHIKSNKLES